MPERSTRKRKSSTLFEGEASILGAGVEKFIRMCVFVFDNLERVTEDPTNAEHVREYRRRGYSINETKQLLFI
jgi:hypothetical protein